MSQDNSTIVQALDAKIAELEREENRLQTAIQRLAAVKSDLDALRKTRALMAGGVSAMGVNGNGAAVSHQGDRRKESRIVPGSIGYFALEVLREAGAPVHVKELLPRVRAKGKPELTESTLISVLCGYVS
jgi:hypothetical protein